MTPNRSMWRGVAGLLAALSMGALPACGGDDDGSEPADAAASEPAADDNSGDDGAGDDGGGDSDASGGSGDAGSAGTDGADFPIPAPDGLVLDALVDSGLDLADSGQRQLYYENDDFDRVVSFYDDWTSQDGNWSRGESEGTVVYQDVGGDSLRMITISPGHDPGAQADGPVTFVLLVTNE